MQALVIYKYQHKNDWMTFYLSVRHQNQSACFSAASPPISWWTSSVSNRAQMWSTPVFWSNRCQIHQLRKHLSHSVVYQQIKQTFAVRREKHSHPATSSDQMGGKQELAKGRATLPWNLVQIKPWLPNDVSSDFEWNVLTATGWIAMKFVTDIYTPFWMTFGDHLTFRVVASLGQMSNFSSDGIVGSL